MLSDEEMKQAYYASQGINTHDASRQFYLKAIKDRAKERGYKVTGFNHMPVYQLKSIYNKFTTK